MGIITVVCDYSLQVQQLQGVCNLQEPHFWTLCTDVYIGTLKLLVAPDADSRWILSQTHNIFTQVRARCEASTSFQDLAVSVEIYFDRIA